MAYTEGQQSAANPYVGTVAVDVLTATGVHTYSQLIQERTAVSRLLLTVTTLVAADTTLAVVTYKRRPTFGSSSGEVTLGTITVPDATAVGKVLFKNIDEAELNAGEELVFEVTTAAVDGGGATGGALYGVTQQEAPEDPRNVSDMIASA